MPAARAVRQLAKESRIGQIALPVESCFLALFSGIAFAAIGRQAPDGPTPLQALFGFPKLSDESS
jgi:hypothetical protein